jgi:hypothetical protein
MNPTEALDQRRSVIVIFARFEALDQKRQSASEIGEMDDNVRIGVEQVGQGQREIGGGELVLNHEIGDALECIVDAGRNNRRLSRCRHEAGVNEKMAALAVSRFEQKLVALLGGSYSFYLLSRSVRTPMILMASPKVAPVHICLVPKTTKPPSGWGSAEM